MTDDLIIKLREYLKSQNVKSLELDAQIEDCEHHQTWIVKNRNNFSSEEEFYNALCENNTKKTLAILKRTMIEQELRQLYSLLGNKIEVNLGEQ